MHRRSERAAVAGKVTPKPGEAERRNRIIQEFRLRRDIEYEEKIRRESPDYWRWKEAMRLESNRADAELNRQLRAAGCRPVSRSLTLKEKVKKLQQLESRNRAEIAILRELESDSPKKPGRYTIRSR